MRAHRDRDERIAGRAATQARSALPFEAQSLAVLDARGDGDVQRLAVRHIDALLGAVHGFEELHGKRVVHIPAAHAEVRFRAAPLAPAPPLHEIGENTAQVGEAAQILRALVAEASASARIIAVEPALGLRLAGGVRLAGVEGPPLSDRSIGCKRRKCP